MNSFSAFLALLGGIPDPRRREGKIYDRIPTVRDALRARADTVLVGVD